MSWRNTLFFGMRLTAEQEAYLDSIEKNRLTIVNAGSGTGKTTLAVGMAKLIGRPLLYTFATVEEKAIGFTTGDDEAKELKYLSPLLDAMEAIGEKDSALFRKKYGDEKAFHNKGAWITAHSHNFVRGSNKKGMTVILDEAQNWTKHELKKMLTRLHDDCKVIVIGHTGQIDLPNPSHSGFQRVIDHLGSKHYANVIELTKNFRGELSQDADEL